MKHMKVLSAALIVAFASCASVGSWAKDSECYDKKPLVKTAKEHVMPGTMSGIEIKASKLGDNAGITGAAVLARRATA